MRRVVAGDIELTTTGPEDDPADRFILRRQRAADLRASEPEPVPGLPLDIPGAVCWEGGEIVVSIDPIDACDETIDLDCVVPPLLVRRPLPGDRFEPLGMSGRGMTLNDFFRGRALRQEERRGTPLLCDADGIVWVVGHRIADRVKITAETRRTLCLRWAAGVDRAR